MQYKDPLRQAVGAHELHDLLHGQGLRSPGSRLQEPSVAQAARDPTVREDCPKHNEIRKVTSTLGR